jgi:two-component system, OmpR family, response regulator
MSDGKAVKAMRILVVDDNQDGAESLALLLQLDGHDVRTAMSGAAALEIAPVFQPEVLLLDIGLPGMDGYELARRLRQSSLSPDAVLIAITGYGQESDKLRSARAGFTHHLVKPIDPAALDELLHAAALAS